MIPLRDVIPSRTTPYVTIAIIAVNALAWFYELSLPANVLPRFLSVYGVVPADFHASTILSSMFLHGSWLHVIGNMWYLWIFGDNIEDRLGHGRYVLFYLLCGAGAAIGHVAAQPESLLPTIGASGAIAGVMGAYFVLYPRSRVLTLIPLIIVFEIIELPAYFPARLLVPDAAGERGRDCRHGRHPGQRRHRLCRAHRRVRGRCDRGLRAQEAAGAGGVVELTDRVLRCLGA